MTSLQTVNYFYQLNNDIPAGKASFEELEAMLTGDFTFSGPLMKIEGAANYMSLLRQFLTFHESLRVLRQFVDQDEVCSITELKLRTPTGESLTMDIAEWIKVENGKLRAHTIYYDPRAFAQAFPM